MDRPQPITSTYQWQRCDADGDNCTDIPAPTDDTYTLTADDDGDDRPRQGDLHERRPAPTPPTSDPTAVVDGDPPVNVVDPTISGTARDGATLTARQRRLDRHAPITPAYQWLRCDAAGANCSDIAGADRPTYALGAADVGDTIRVVVTYTNIGGNASEPTEPSAVVVAAPPAVTIDPTVIGTAVDGETLTADPGVWSGTAPIDFTYQWLRCDLDGTNCDDDRRRHRRRVHADQRGRRPRHPRRGHRHQRRRHRRRPPRRSPP